MKLASKRASLKKVHSISNSLYLPMLRYLPQPLHSRILHRHPRIKPLRHCMTDEGSTLLLQQLDQPLFLRYQGVDFGSFAVEEGGDGALFRKRRNNYWKRSNIIQIYSTLGTLLRSSKKMCLEIS